MIFEMHLGLAFLAAKVYAVALYILRHERVNDNVMQECWYASPDVFQALARI